MSLTRSGEWQRNIRPKRQRSEPNRTSAAPLLESSAPAREVTPIKLRRDQGDGNGMVDRIGIEDGDEAFPELNAAAPPCFPVLRRNAALDMTCWRGAGIQLMIGFQAKAITSCPDLAGFIQPRLSVSKMPHKSA